MAGRRAGVATKIKEVEPRTLYIHCTGHSLNLAVQDTCRSVSIINEALDTILELSKIFKYVTVSEKARHMGFFCES